MTAKEREMIRAAAKQRAAELLAEKPLTESEQRKLRVLLGSARAA